MDRNWPWPRGRHSRRLPTTTTTTAPEESDTKHHKMKQVKLPFSEVISTMLFMLMMQIVRQASCLSGSLSIGNQNRNHNNYNMNVFQLYAPTGNELPSGTSGGSAKNRTGENGGSSNSAAGCSDGLLTFELSTGFIYKPASAETLAMMPSTLQLTDCLDYCLQNSSCLAINFEMGLCVLLSSSAKQNPLNLYSSQFPVFTIYAEKKCLLAGDAQAQKQRRRCQRAWTFERVAGYEMKTRPKRRLKFATKEQCMEACLLERDFECRSANWFRQTGECSLSDQDRHSVSLFEETGDQVKPSSLSQLYGPSTLSAGRPGFYHNAAAWTATTTATYAPSPVPSSNASDTLEQQQLAASSQRNVTDSFDPTMAGASAIELTSVSRAQHQAEGRPASPGQKRLLSNSQTPGPSARKARVATTSSGSYKKLRAIRNFFDELQRVREGSTRSNINGQSSWSFGEPSQDLAMDSTNSLRHRQHQYNHQHHNNDNNNDDANSRHNHQHFLPSSDWPGTPAGHYSQHIDLPASAPVDYLENNCIYEPNKLCEFRKIQNRVLKTVDSIYQDVNSLDECKQKCLSAPYRCYSFDYGDTSERVCRTSHLDQASLLAVKEPYLDVVGAVTYELTSCFNVSIQCSAREMVAQVSASKMFKGKIYVKSRPSSCQNDVSESLHFQLAMPYHDPDCDVRSSAGSQRGVFSNDIVIQHHDRIITSQDVGLSVYCQYELGNRNITNSVDLAIERIDADFPASMESKNRPATPGGALAHSAPTGVELASSSGSQPLTITSLATTVVRSPNVTMRITNMNGQPVTSATVGDRLALLFEIKEKSSPFGIFVREIIALDGKQLIAASNNNGISNSTNSGRGYHYGGGANSSRTVSSEQITESAVESVLQTNAANSIQFIDANGCPTDANIMGPLVKMDAAGQRLLAPFDAFKFPTSDMVFFRAVVSSCIPECRPASCSGSLNSAPALLPALAAASSTEAAAAPATTEPTPFGPTRPGGLLSAGSTATIAAATTANANTPTRQHSEASSRMTTLLAGTTLPVDFNSYSSSTAASALASSTTTVSSAADSQAATTPTLTRDAFQAAAGGGGSNTASQQQQARTSSPAGDSLTTVPGFSVAELLDQQRQPTVIVLANMTNNHQQQAKLPPRPPMQSGGQPSDRLPPLIHDSLTAAQRQQLIKLFESKLRQQLTADPQPQPPTKTTVDLQPQVAQQLAGVNGTQAAPRNGGVSVAELSELYNTSEGGGNSLSKPPSSEHSAAVESGGQRHEPPLLPLPQLEQLLARLLSEATNRTTSGGSGDSGDFGNQMAANGDLLPLAKQQQLAGEQDARQTNSLQGDSMMMATEDATDADGSGNSANLLQTALAPDNNYNDLSSTWLNSSIGLPAIAQQTFDWPATATTINAADAAPNSPATSQKETSGALSGPIRSQQQRSTKQGQHVQSIAPSGDKLGATVAGGHEAAAMIGAQTATAEQANSRVAGNKAKLSNLQALADSYLGALQGRRRRKRSSQHTEQEADEANGGLSPSTGYSISRQAQVAPSGAGQLRFTEGIVELYHTGSGSYMESEERVEAKVGRVKRELAQPRYDLEDELVVQSIKIVDRLQLGEQEQRRQQVRARQQRRRQELQEQRQPRRKSSRVVDEQEALAAEQARMGGELQRAAKAELGRAWSGSGALCLALIAVAFVFIQVFLVSIFLLDWNWRRRHRAPTTRNPLQSEKRCAAGPLLSATTSGQSICGSQSGSSMASVNSKLDFFLPKAFAAPSVASVASSIAANSRQHQLLLADEGNSRQAREPFGQHEQQQGRGHELGHWSGHIHANTWAHDQQVRGQRSAQVGPQTCKLPNSNKREQQPL